MPETARESHPLLIAAFTTGVAALTALVFAVAIVRAAL